MKDCAVLFLVVLSMVKFPRAVFQKRCLIRLDRALAYDVTRVDVATVSWEFIRLICCTAPRSINGLNCKGKQRSK